MSLAYTILCDSSDRERWLQERQSGIGASEMPAALGEDPWTSALELYVRKTSPVEPEEEAKDFRWVGRRIEDFLASLYAELTGREIRKAGQLLRSTRHPWALATLDYEVKIQLTWNTWSWCPLELKNVVATKGHEWKDGAPQNYKTQCQQQSLVCKAPITSIFALIGGNTPVWEDVPWCRVEHSRIVYAGEQFWKRVVRREPPAPDGSDSAGRAVAAMNATETGGVNVALSGDAVDIADSILALKKARSSADREIKRLEQSIKMELGDAEYGVLPDGRVYSYRTTKVASKTVDSYSFRKLCLHKTMPKKRG